MESREKVELLHRAIKKILVEEEKTSGISESLISVGNNDHSDSESDGENRSLSLVSRLLSQLDSLKSDDLPELHPSEATEKSAMTNEVGSDHSELIGNEEIIKELREVKKQNTRTHWLLSAVIALTLVWQLGEVSLILKVKEGLSNPFKSIGGMITGMFKAPAGNGRPVESNGNGRQKELIQAYTIPGVKVPELPHSFFKVDDDDD